MANLDLAVYNTTSVKNYSFLKFSDSKIYKNEISNTWVQHVIFGDYIKILDTEIQNGRVYVRGRDTNGWISADMLQKNRILEVNFVDIGQGDGCHMVTPDDEHYIIDAGKGDNMYRYLYWRFNLENNQNLPFKFKAIISHPDNDHYLGFGEIFDAPQIQFDKVYHNGIVQKPIDLTAGWDTQIGHLITQPNGDKFLVSIVNSDNGFKSILNDQANLSGSGSQYPKTMAKLLNQPIPPIFEALSKQSGYITGNGHDDEFSLEVLSPITSQENNQEMLPYFGSMGKTKNGHSVLIKLKYKKLKVMLGGDINEEAGEYINKCYGINALDALMVDIAKACHHGSHHFSYAFLENINALGTVISSGDDENYSHPRPDTLGAIGKTGYSDRPLIFSTELARSNKEFSSSSIPELVGKYQKSEAAQLALEEYRSNNPTVEDDDEQLNILEEEYITRYKEVNSYLTRHGMISLRSDGIKMIMSQKLERDSRSSKFDIYKFEFDKNAGRFIK